MYRPRNIQDGSNKIQSSSSNRLKKERTLMHIPRLIKLFVALSESISSTTEALIQIIESFSASPSFIPPLAVRGVPIVSNVTVHPQLKELALLSGGKIWSFSFTLSSTINRFVVAVLLLCCCCIVAVLLLSVVGIDPERKVCFAGSATSHLSININRERGKKEKRGEEEKGRKETRTRTQTHTHTHTHTHRGQRKVTGEGESHFLGLHCSANFWLLVTFK